MIEAETLALVFIVIGVIFLITEGLSPGVFLLIPGTVLVILGIIGYVYPDFLYSVWSPVLALLVAVPVTLGTVKMYQILARPEPPTTTIGETLIGKNGIVTVRTDPKNITGKVRIDSDTWSATSSEPIEVGTEITVAESQGVHVKVVRRNQR
ncbi:MAG: NfeD family protein [Methanomassiliicoccaceae archaeon]|jgi:membrane protein implicated in regulation of membrane protease activity|nr:NfeD family protein [Methanomassiliicoccaceae archaeon]